MKTVLLNVTEFMENLKRLKKLKLNALSETSMQDKEMNALKGGSACGCSCYWEGDTGSTVEDNAKANYRIGSGYSSHRCNKYSYYPGWGVNEHNVLHA